MLHEFSQYLEATLVQLRASQSSLGRELALTCAYLNVQQIRMGKRLGTQIHLPDRLKGAAFPPMMLITLVENRSALVPEIMRRIHDRTGRAYTVGMTGPPGAGKSTLVDALTARLRKTEARVGIVALQGDSVPSHAPCGSQ